MSLPNISLSTVAMTWTVLVCLLVPLLLETQGQSLEGVVRDAVGSSFDGMRTKSLIPAGRFILKGAGLLWPFLNYIDLLKMKSSV